MVEASKISDQDALDFHAQGKPGKLEMAPTKNLTTQRDLSLAYSPGAVSYTHLTLPTKRIV